MTLLDHIDWENRLWFCQGGDREEEIFRVGRFWVGQLDGRQYCADIEAMERFVEFCRLEGVEFVPWRDLIFLPAGLDDLEDHLMELCKIVKRMGWSSTTIFER